MKILRNKKGMTLVEIIVVLLIMSILLVIMGSLILNAFNYFNKTTDQDINKRSLDSISEYVRSELLYASDVRVQEEKPDEEEWNTLYIIDGKLYKNDETVYSEGFYNHNDLVIKLRGFEQYRLDLNYSFKDMDKANAYSTEDTLELLNLKVKIESDDEFNPFSNISTVTTVTDKVKIYYKKTIEQIKPEIPVNTAKGTVADIVLNLNGHNNLGLFDENNKNRYQNGEMIWFEGNWWERVSRDNNLNPSDGFGWKRLTAEYCAPSLKEPNKGYSSYEKNDIVIYEGYYYKANRDIISHAGTQWNGFITDCVNEYSAWKKLGPIDDPETVALVSKNTYPEKHPNNYNNVVAKYWPADCDMSDLYRSNYELFSENKVYKDGSIVKKLAGSYKGIEYYDLYIKKACFDTNKPPGTADSGWIKLSMHFSNTSTYLKGDIVRDPLNGGNRIFQAVKDITELTVPENDIYNKKIYWKLYE